MDIKYSDIAADIGKLRLNPSLVQDKVYDMIDKVTDGTIDLVDPSTPFNILLSAGCALFSAGQQEHETTTRSSYVRIAKTTDEIYNHMEDVDMLDRFCTPAEASFFFIFSEAEIRKYAVSVPDTDIRKLTIPRNTSITVNGHWFTMTYPVDIKVMPHGGIEAMYDTSISSPLGAPKTNIVKLYQRNLSNIPAVILEIPVKQIRISSQFVTMTPGSHTNVQYRIQSPDQFYYCRVFMSDGSGGWTELATTYSDFNYDISVPTAVVKAVGETLNISIPIIYTTNNLITGSTLRIDIYSSRGVVNLDLGSLDPTLFERKWVDLEKADNGLYYAPLNKLSYSLISSPDYVKGGANGLTLEEIRRRMITNMTTIRNPITRTQLNEKMRLKGYDIILARDVPGERTFLATRHLPAPESRKFDTGIGCAMELFETSFDGLLASDAVRDNGQRMTILPEALFVRREGRIALVSGDERRNLDNMTPDQLANQINNNSYGYTPFHYVLDATRDAFELRPYYFHQPVITMPSFVESNETRGYNVSPGTYNLDKTENGFLLTVVCNSDDAWKRLDDAHCHAQLGFRIEGETNYAFVNGKQLPNTINGERVYEFEILTNWDLDYKHNLIVKNFVMMTSVVRDLPLFLQGDLDIGFSVSGVQTPTAQQRPIDTWIGKTILPYDAVGISRSRITVTLGHALPWLWANARPVDSSKVYATWDEDVYETYERDDFEVNIVDGKVEYNVKHKRGDVVMDSEGNPAILFKKGSVKLDPTGEPIELLARQVQYHIDLLLLDGVYYFATADEDRNYSVGVAQEIVKWLTTDIAEMNDATFEESRLLFYPKRTIGNATILIDNGRQVTIPADQSFHVTYSMTLVSYTNEELKTALRETGSKIISKTLLPRTVSTSDIVSELRKAGGSDIIGVVMDALGPNKDINTYTALDDSVRLKIRRKLSVLPEGTMEVVEDIAFDFVAHQLENVNKV